jgi:hypothetical protein
MKIYSLINSIVATELCVCQAMFARRYLSQMWIDILTQAATIRVPQPEQSSRGWYQMS